MAYESPGIRGDARFLRLGSTMEPLKTVEKSRSGLTSFPLNMFGMGRTTQSSGPTAQEELKAALGETLRLQTCRDCTTTTEYISK